MRYEILSPLSTRGGDIRPLTTDLEGQRPRWPAYQQKPERPPHRSRLTRMAAEAVGPPSGSHPVFSLMCKFCGREFRPQIHKLCFADLKAALVCCLTID